MNVDTPAALYETAKRVHYPAGKMGWRAPVNGKGFFPICNGFLCDYAQPPSVDVLILGQDFGTQDYYQRVLESNAKNPGSGELDLRNATLVNLCKLLSETGLDRERIFCTNAYPGVRVSGRMTEPCHGRNDPDYRRDAIALFEQTLRAFPEVKTIFALGLEAASFLKQAFPDGAENWRRATRLRHYCDAENVGASVEFEGRLLQVFFLLHPSFSAIKPDENPVR